MSFVKTYRDLDKYQNAIELAMKVFELTKTFPTEERFVLTDQIRRSSRSVCTNIAEAWRKRRYRAAFVAKLSDSESEGAETQVSMELALRCRYCSREVFEQVDAGYETVLAQLVRTADHADQWLIKPRRESE
jgi:four helix bundle protein